MPGASKLHRLPARGPLLCVSDLHGNLRDFLQVTALFERLGSDAQLLFLGDLIHGPRLRLEDWSVDAPLPGRPYCDQSPAILFALEELCQRHPGRVTLLLGHHEHTHIGGPRTSRFAADEAAALEQRLGIETSTWLAARLRGLPLWAVAPCGLLFSHAAPAVRFDRLSDIDRLDYHRISPLVGRDLHQPALPPSEAASASSPFVLGHLMWTRSLSPTAARSVLHSAGAHVAVYGHSIIPAGAQAIGAQQLILSSSYGMEDHKKRVLLLDLARPYHHVSALREGHELLPLYPPGMCAAHQGRGERSACSTTS